MKEWIYDEKKWQDVFTCKPYEYLNIVAQMKTPWFDRDNNVWVDKEEFDAANGKATADVDSEIETAKQAVYEVSNVGAVENKAQSFADSLTLDEDDMPF